MSIEIRTSSDGQSWELSGLASATDVWYPVIDHRGKYQERVAPGAFRQSLSQNPRVRLLVEHDRSGPLLGRTGRNLRLSESSRGLEVAATLDRSDPDAQSAVSKVRTGLLDSMSFAFGILDGDSGQQWSEDYSRRTVLSADLDGGDVSIVEFGCNPATSVSVRSDELKGRALADAIGLEVRSYGASGIAVAEKRGDYTDKEKAVLGAVGKAVWIDGHWAFPVNSEADFNDAVTSIGRTPGKNRGTVRKYLIGLAKKNGWDIPSTWNSDGSTKSTPRSVPTFEENELVLRSIEYAASGQRGADLRLSAELASPEGRLARAVAASRRAELEFELLRRR
jgi:HK97 family phage prohead protease